MKKLSIISAFVFSAVLVLPMFSVAAENVSTPIEKLISEIADKPDQHQAIANYYKEKIAEANQELVMHTKMRKAYEVGYVKSQDAMVSMRKHCDKLISNAEANIKVYEALVAEHEGMATKKHHDH